MAKGGGGGAGGAGRDRGSVDVTLATQAGPVNADELSAFPDGPQRNEAEYAAKPSKWDEVITARAGDKLVGIVSVWKDPDRVKEEEMPEGRYLRIRNMASAQRGVGRQLFQEVLRRAADQRSGVYLSSLQGSRGFYEKLGMRAGLGATYFLTAADVSARING